MNSNIAVVMAGRRRFTLFPPDQVGNLYVGHAFPPAVPIKGRRIGNAIMA